MSKKLCHISTAHATYDTRIFHKECKSLAEAGFAVYLVIRSASGSHERDGVRIRAIKAWDRRLPRIILGSIQAALRVFQINPGVLVLHDPELIPLGLFFRILGKKVIFDMHELVAAQIGDKEWLGKGRGMAGRLYLSFEKLAVRHFNHILLAEGGYWEYIRSTYPNQLHKFVLVRNFPDLKRIDAIPALPPSSEHFRLIYAGGLTAIRGAGEMLDAIEELEVNLELLGSWESQVLRERCERKRAYSKVSYHGPVQFEEVIGRLKSSQCGLALLHPVQNYTSSLPVKVFEYLSCGIPVIASDFPLWKEMFPEGVLFVDPQNPAAIKQAIVQFMNHPERAREMGEAGRKLVEQKYNWQNEAEKLMRVV